MKARDVSNWLTVGANLGVLVGIIFLIVEIDQANTIAEREARSGVIAEFSETERVILQSPHLVSFMSTLMDGNADLTIEEAGMARSYSILLFNSWAQVNVAFDTGLIPTNTQGTYLQTLRDQLQTIPRILPFVKSSLIERGIERGEYTSVYDVMWDEIEAADL